MTKTLNDMKLRLKTITVLKYYCHNLILDLYNCFNFSNFLQHLFIIICLQTFFRFELVFVAKVPALESRNFLIVKGTKAYTGIKKMDMKNSGIFCVYLKKNKSIALFNPLTIDRSYDRKFPMRY